MDSIHIDGGIPLQGQVRIQGSKNAALPVMAATVLINGKCLIENCPKITDVFQMQTLLESIGCRTLWEGHSLRIDATGVCDSIMPIEAVKSMRSSISLLGPLLARSGEAFLYHPGGCVIGERPIDIHIHAMECLGVNFKEEEQYIHGTVSQLTGSDIFLKFPSVGATENAIMASVLAEGDTNIYPAAMEPEIVALCEFLRKAGAIIEGDGTALLHVKGVRSLHETSFRIPSDRIVAGTYITGCMIAGGSIFLGEAPVTQMAEIIRTAGCMGVIFQDDAEGIFVQAPEKLKMPKHIVTGVYPEFPTDMQSMFLAAMCVADGKGILTEKIFENRFHIVDELRQMGAMIELQGDSAYINGVRGLTGTDVHAEELRGGAALVMAGLGATGHTVVTGCEYICRGYENICRDLRELGARVYSI